MAVIRLLHTLPELGAFIRHEHRCAQWKPWLNTAWILLVQSHVIFDHENKYNPCIQDFVLGLTQQWMDLHVIAGQLSSLNKSFVGN